VYALVLDGEIVEVRNPRRTGEFKLSDGRLIRPPASGWTDSLAATCGFIPVTDPGAPPITSLQTFDPSTVELIGGAPTTVHHPRDKTAAELAADADAADRAAKALAVSQAVATLRQWAVEARGVTVTTTNSVVVLQTVVTRLGVFFDRFADLVQSQRLDR
jgi:hypothetical protein